MSKIWEKISALAKEQVNIFSAELGFFKGISQNREFLNISLIFHESLHLSE